MRIRRSVVRFFGLAVFPAVSAAVIGYFGYNAVWGERGLEAMNRTRIQLAVANAQLSQLDDQRARLQHRIQLLDQPNPDPDLVEELARTQLMDGAQGQVAVPRDKQ
jgi:cell division protein FtsB